jgi:ATP-dependent helicase HepA
VHSWSVGDSLTHRFNPELGTGRILAIESRVLVVEFPKAGATLRMAASSDALVPAAAAEQPWRADRSLFERLAAGDVDETQDVLTRVDILHLLAVREADGLGSFLGGRVRLFPHQLHVAERATERLPVRWLLADEVGLGKTIEAALIMNRLLHTQQIERCLVVAPESLTVQWLGELWRKYHQVFALLDAARLADVARDFGNGFNPFDVHRRAVIALETLIARPDLTRHAVKAGIDLLVVDEAQRLRRPPRHPGEPGYRAIAPIAALGRHVLLLSATPLEDEAHGFFRLLQMLRPDEFPEEVNVEARLASGVPLPPCTSSTRRVDVGGLPPRVPVPIDLPDARQNQVGAGAPAGAGDGDGRLDWLVTQAKRWREAGEKTLVFTARRETLEMLRQAFSARAQLATSVFHEDLSTARRDIEVARFRAEDGPSLLVSTEAGGEGRNFEFCHRLVLFDLPWKPATVEQRIGRLDRIGRRMPVEIVYFRPPSGVGAAAVRLFEQLGIFREPMAGLEPQLTGIEGVLEEVAHDPEATLSDARIDEVLADARAARGRIHAAAYEQLHRDRYQAGLASSILARVPAGLDALMEQVVVNAASRLGFHVEQVRGRRAYAIDFGNEALIDSLPGVPGGSSFVGSFDREYAVEDEGIDFYASGHPLVEGLLAHFDEDRKGRVGRLELQLSSDAGIDDTGSGDAGSDEAGSGEAGSGNAGSGDAGIGIIAFYKDGPQVTIDALDEHGVSRPGWAAAFRERVERIRRMKADDVAAYDWASLVARLAPRLEPGRPHAIAALVVRD